jgi:hypothetical protein
MTSLTAWFLRNTQGWCLYFTLAYILVSIHIGNPIRSWYAGVKYRRQASGFLRNPALDEVTSSEGDNL